MSGTVAQRTSPAATSSTATRSIALLPSPMSRKRPAATWRASGIQLVAPGPTTVEMRATTTGTAFHIASDWGNTDIEVHTLGTFNVAPTWNHLFSSTTVLTAGFYVRRDAYNYYPSGSPFADLGPSNLQQETVSQDRSLTNYGVKGDMAYTAGRSNFKVGGSASATRLVENFSLGFTDPTFTLTYSRTIHAPSAGTCATYPNTARFTSNNGDTGSAGQSVQVCAFQAPLTIGYWGNHLAPNGTAGCTGLPSGTGCSSNGPWANKYLPQPLGGYSVTTFQTVAKVIAANNCSNATTSAQNAVGCLAAQLLAAELNVAFGSNTCIITNANGINAANAFLTGISYNGPTGTYTLTTAQRNTALTLKNELVNYNQGGGC